MRPVVLLLIAMIAGGGLAPRSADAQTPRPDRRGIVFFVGGAGGSGILTDWAEDVEEGLRAGGWRGRYRNVDWQSGWGALVDQIEDKDDEAFKFARQIESYRKHHPDGQIYIIAHSAGTAVALHALENLQPGFIVDRVVLLHPSVSRYRDLGSELSHIRGRMYVVASAEDETVEVGTDVLGTADRDADRDTPAGRHGFARPDGRGRGYRKLVQLQWNEAWEEWGHEGDHTDAVSEEFAEEFLAPLLKTGRVPWTD